MKLKFLSFALFFFNFLLFGQELTSNNSFSSNINSTEFDDGCLDAEYGQYPLDVFEPICMGIVQDVTPIGWAGEFSKVNVTQGTEYIFSSTVSSDFITIGNNDGNLVLAAGLGSVTWTSDFNGTIRFYTHLDGSCASSNTTSRARRVQCGENPPPPINDECENAIALTCGETGVGQTYSANDSGARESNDIFFTYTGNGTPEYVTMSLCGSSFNTFVHVYSDCSLTNEIAFGNYGCDSGDLSSIVSFTSDGVSTYVIVVEGYDDDDFGDFVYELSCMNVPPPPQDCEEFEVLSNWPENSFGAISIHLAADLPIGDNGFTIYGMRPNLLSEIGEIASFVNFEIYEDNVGLPGNLITTRTGTIVNYSNSLGIFQGAYQIRNYTVAFDSPLTFNPNTRYWISIDSDAAGWEYSSVYGSLGFADVQRDLQTGLWEPMENPQQNFVFNLICNELGVNDSNLVDFAYYPNPSIDFVNIISPEKIESISIYDLSGKKRMHQDLGLKDPQIEIHHLTTGTYIFHVILENGQVETFKIVKK